MAQQMKVQQFYQTLIEENDMKSAGPEELYVFLMKTNIANVKRNGCPDLIICEHGSSVSTIFHMSRFTAVDKKIPVLITQRKHCAENYQIFSNIGDIEATNPIFITRTKEEFNKNRTIKYKLHAKSSSFARKYSEIEANQIMNLISINGYIIKFLNQGSHESSDLHLQNFVSKSNESKCLSICNMHQCEKCLIDILEFLSTAEYESIKKLLDMMIDAFSMEKKQPNVYLEEKFPSDDNEMLINKIQLRLKDFPKEKLNDINGELLILWRKIEQVMGEDIDQLDDAAPRNQVVQNVDGTTIMDREFNEGPTIQDIPSTSNAQNVLVDQSQFMIFNFRQNSNGSNEVEEETL